MTATVSARHTLSGMTEITEASLRATFDRDRHRDVALYRDCPSAFWLAPDADLADTPVPVRSETVLTCPDQRPPEAIEAGVGGRAAGMFRALLVAGPVFTALWLTLDGATRSDSWWTPLTRAAGSLVLAPFTILTGIILGMLPILVGTFGLSEAGQKLPVLRRRAAWAGTGGAMGATIAAAVGADGAAGVSLIGTAIACAIVAHSPVSWTDARPA